MNMAVSTIYSRGNRHDMQDSLLRRSQFGAHSLVLCILPFLFSHPLWGF